MSILRAYFGNVKIGFGAWAAYMAPELRRRNELGELQLNSYRYGMRANGRNLSLTHWRPEGADHPIDLTPSPALANGMRP